MEVTQTPPHFRLMLRLETREILFLVPGLNRKENKHANLSSSKAVEVSTPAMGRLVKRTPYSDFRPPSPPVTA